MIKFIIKVTFILLIKLSIACQKMCKLTTETPALSLAPSAFQLRRRQWHPTPVLLPGKSHGQRSLVGCSPWGLWELDTTERLHFHFSLSCIGEGNGNPLQCSCLQNPRDRGAWWAAVHGVAQSQTRLQRLTSSSSSSSVESLSHVRIFVTPWTAAHQASVSITNSWSLLILMSKELVMPSNHLILCRPLFLLPSIFTSIRVFSDDQFFTLVGQNIGVSASSSVLPINIQE